MLENIVFFLERSRNDPLYLTFCTALPFLIFFFINRNNLKIQNLVTRCFWKLIPPLCVFALAGYIVYALWYLLSPMLPDHVLPSFLINSWMVAQGKELYHTLDSAERYSFLYGPLSYLFYGSSLKLFGPDILSGKLPGVIAGLATIIVIFFSLDNRKQKEAFAFTCLWCMLLLLFDHRSFRTKADPFLLLAAALAFLAVRFKIRIAAVILLGIAAGLCTGLKAHGIIYCLPAAAIMIKKWGWRYAAVSGVIAVLTAAAAFLFPNISFTNYFLFLKNSGGHGLVFMKIVKNAKWALFLSIPAICLMIFMFTQKRKKFWRVIKKHRSFLLCFSVSVILACIAGGKLGANWQHLIPLLPLWIYGTYWLWKKCDIPGADLSRLGSIGLALICAFIISSVLLMTGSVLTIVRSNTKIDEARNVQKDIRDILNRHNNDSIQMGYGNNESYAKTYNRFMLCFNGQPVFIEAPALMGMQRGGSPVGDSTINRLKNGNIKIWLIPKGDQPFIMKSKYPPAGSFEGKADLFGPAFRSVFHTNYELLEQSQFFDVWYYKG